MRTKAIVIALLVLYFGGFALTSWATAVNERLMINTYLGKVGIPAWTPPTPTETALKSLGVGVIWPLVVTVDAFAYLANETAKQKLETR